MSRLSTKIERGTLLSLDDSRFSKTSRIPILHREWGKCVQFRSRFYYTEDLLVLMRKAAPLLGVQDPMWTFAEENPSSGINLTIDAAVTLVSVTKKFTGHTKVAEYFQNFFGLHPLTPHELYSFCGEYKSLNHELNNKHMRLVSLSRISIGQRSRYFPSLQWSHGGREAKPYDVALDRILPDIWFAFVRRQEQTPPPS